MIRNEEKVNEGENLTINQLDLLNKKSKKSICEITKDKGYGSGFFCKIKLPNNNNKEIYCLITNNHVITKGILINTENIEIKLNNEKIKISLNKNRRIWANEKKNFTCIEILK